MDIIQLNPLFKFDSSGALITSAEGTPTAGDASSYNQLQQIMIATNANIATISSLSSINSNIQNSNSATNEKLGLINTAIDSGNQLISDINDKITICNTDSVNITNQISGYSLETTSQSILSNIQTFTSNLNSGNSKSINLLQQLEKQYSFYGKQNEIFLNTADGITAYADSVPAPTIDTLNREGWAYTNPVLGNKYNYYYFSATGYQIQAQNVTGQYVIFQNDVLSTRTDLVPILAIYTVGTNQGWYNGRRSYSTSQAIQPGVKYLAYWGANPTIFPELPRIQLSLASTVGLWQDTDLVLTLSTGSNSGTPENQVKNLTTHIGWVSTGGIETTTTLYGSTKNISTDIQILNNSSNTNTILTNSNLSINGKLGLLATEETLFSSFGELQSINGTIASIGNDLQNLSSIVSTEATLSLVKDELITLNNLGIMTDATGQSIDASLLITNDRLQTIITDYSTSPGLKTNLIAESYENPGTYLQCKITETNNGLLIKDIDGPLETTQWAIYQDTQAINTKLEEIKLEIQTVANESTLEDIALNISDNLIKCDTDNVNILNDFVLESTFQDSNIAICDRLDTINTSIQGITPGGASSNSNVTVLNSNLNTHIYGFHNDTWSAIKVNGVGHLICDTSTQDGAGEAITSHLINTDRGLDTYIINPSVEVSNIWLPYLGTIDTKATAINTSIGQTNTILSGQSIQLNDIILETQTNNTKTQSIVDNTSTINSSIGTTNSYLASGNILLDDIKTEAEEINTHLTTIESGLATIEATIGTATQKVSLYSASESPLNSTSNALNIYQTNNPTSTNITASDTALTATGSSLNINQTNNPTSINIKANDTVLTATSSSLNSYITNPKITVMSPGSSALGSRGNLWNNASVAAQSSTVNLNVDEFTTSVISYEDTSTAATSDILVFGRAFGSGSLDWQYLGKLIPILSSALSKRYAVGVFRLHQFAYIYLYNNSTTQALTNVYASVTSEYVA